MRALTHTHTTHSRIQNATHMHTRSQHILTQQNPLTHTHNKHGTLITYTHTTHIHRLHIHMQHKYAYTYRCAGVCMRTKWWC